MQVTAAKTTQSGTYRWTSEKTNWSLFKVLKALLLRVCTTHTLSIRSLRFLAFSGAHEFDSSLKIQNSFFFCNKSLFYPYIFNVLFELWVLLLYPIFKQFTFLKTQQIFSFLLPLAMKIILPCLLRSNTFLINVTLFFMYTIAWSAPPPQSNIFNICRLIISISCC